MNYDKIFHEDFNIPNINVSNVYSSILDEMITAFDKVFNRYPDLMNTICTLGDINYVKKTIGELFKKVGMKEDSINSYLDNYIKPNNEIIMSTFTEYNHKTIKSENIFNISLCYSKLFNILNSSNLNEFLRRKGHFKANNITYVIYHELGHILVNILEINNSPLVNYLYYYYFIEKAKAKESISPYVCRFDKYEEFIKEALAEVFAISMYYPKDKWSNLVNQSMFFIDSDYELANKEVFNVQDRYNKIMKKSL